MDLNLKNLDADTRALVAQAYATFRERTTCDEAVRNREPFRGPGRRKTVPPIARELTVDSAFNVVIKCRAMLKRNDIPATDNDVRHVWQDYKAHYLPTDAHRFPATYLASLKLSMLVLRDIFEDTKGYMTSQMVPLSPPSARPKGSMQSFDAILTAAMQQPKEVRRKEPYGLLVNKARDTAKRLKQAATDLEMAELFLRKKGFDIDKADHQQLRHMQSVEKNGEMYPRTYL